MVAGSGPVGTFAHKNPTGPAYFAPQTSTRRRILRTSALRRSEKFGPRNSHLAYENSPFGGCTARDEACRLPSLHVIGGGSSVKSWSFCIFLQRRISALSLREHHPMCLPLFVTLFFELAHVQVTPACHPILGLLDGQRRYQSQARFRVREDPHHPRATPYLLV